MSPRSIPTSGPFLGVHAPMHCWRDVLDLTNPRPNQQWLLTEGFYQWYTGESLSTNQYNTGYSTKIGEYGNFLSHEGTPSHHPVVMDDHDATPLRFVLADQEAAPSIQEWKWNGNTWDNTQKKSESDQKIEAWKYIFMHFMHFIIQTSWKIESISYSVKICNVYIKFHKQNGRFF